MLSSQGFAACSTVLRAWGSRHATAEPLEPQSRGPQALAKASGGGVVALAARGAEARLDMQTQRPKAEPEATGNGEAEAQERGKPGRALDGHSGLRFGNPAFQPWLHCVWGKPQKPHVALGFPSVLGTILSPPRSASSCGWGLWGRAGGSLSFQVARWLYPRTWGGEGVGRAVGSCTVLHLRAAQKATGK